MQLDLGEKRLVAGTAIQPRATYTPVQYVESYTVSYSPTGEDGPWIDIPGTFYGNENRMTKNTFSAPILTRYVRLYPRTAVLHMSMRADVLLCNPFIADTPEENRKYSTIYDGEAIGTGHARSKIDSVQAWSARNSDVNQWMQLDLGYARLVAGTVIQPRATYTPVQYVTSYTVSYSLTGEEGDWTEVPGTYNGEGEDAMYQAIFPEAVLARYVKLHPKAWEVYVSMRADALVVAGTLGII